VTRPISAVPGADKAVLRWKLGHQMFHLHLTTMNTLLAEAKWALESARWSELGEIFDRLRVVYDAATATMRYAADFSPELYDRVIRPSMAPPFTSPGFSGSMNLEHDLMTDQLQELRRRFKQLDRTGNVPRPLRASATRLWAAQSRNRRNHILVCERFVPGVTSLLDEFYQSKDDTEETSQ
jgi:hypothetical protein